MQAIMVTEPGGADVMRVVEVPIPEPGPGEVLVRVLAAGVGAWDTHVRSGQVKVDLPYIPGAEFAGLVEGDTGAPAAFQDGEPVYGYPGLTGCYAQYVTCPAEQMASIPAGLDVVEAAAAPVDALTALQGLRRLPGSSAGDDPASVLITAAAGGPGHLAVQIARTLGPAGLPVSALP
ncbi:MAG: quinone oxidoreductase family protein [Streptosporangiaceae bacterium]